MQQRQLRKHSPNKPPGVAAALAAEAQELSSPPSPEWRAADAHMRRAARLGRTSLPRDLQGDAAGATSQRACERARSAVTGQRRVGRAGGSSATLERVRKHFVTSDELLYGQAIAPDMATQLRHAFGKRDLDYDGVLSVTECRRAIASCGLQLSRGEMNSLAQHVHREFEAPQGTVGMRHLLHFLEGQQERDDAAPLAGTKPAPAPAPRCIPGQALGHARHAAAVRQKAATTQHEPSVGALCLPPGCSSVAMSTQKTLWGRMLAGEGPRTSQGTRRGLDVHSSGDDEWRAWFRKVTVAGE